MKDIKFDLIYKSDTTGFHHKKHYVSDDCHILFESDSYFIDFSIYGGTFGERSMQLKSGINKMAKPIPRKQKPFDITQHEFSDAIANLKAMKSERGDIVIRIGSSWIFLDKADSIAIAKALGVTCEDLK